MKSSTSYLKYLKKIAKTINKILKNSPGKLENEDFHQLRVAIKKLEALMDFTAFNAEKFKKKKHFKAFKKIFRQSGKIREWQLEKHMLEKYPLYDIDQYLKKISRRIRKEEKKFALLNNKKQRRKINKSLRKMEPYIKKANEEMLIQFIENETNKTKNIIHQTPLEPGEVHELRKRLKVDFYNKKMPGFKNKKIEDEAEFLELIGNWHDSRLLNNLLEKAIIKDKIEQEELKNIIEINYEIFFDAKKMLEEINDKVAEKLKAQI